MQSVHCMSVRRFTRFLVASPLQLPVLRLTTAALAVVLFANCDQKEPGPFEQVGYCKKALPNGSNERVFSFYVSNFGKKSPAWWQLEDHAAKLPYTDGGTTTAFYFSVREGTPDVTSTCEEWPRANERYCVAGYWRYANGRRKFAKYPFK